jgi:hypothetical protein
MKHQGDRIISAVTAGPHDKIIDRVSTRHKSLTDANTPFYIKDVHSIWKDMVRGCEFVLDPHSDSKKGWRGSVKTRRFVMALRDYFQENHNHESANGEPGSHVKADDWALQYIEYVRRGRLSHRIPNSDLL